MLLRRRRREPLDALRKRIIRETEITLLYALRFPERFDRIPTVEAGSGSFRRDFARQFWAEQIGVEETESPSERRA